DEEADVLRVVVLTTGLDGLPLDAKAGILLGFHDSLVGVEVEGLVAQLADVRDETHLPGFGTTRRGRSRSPAAGRHHRGQKQDGTEAEQTSGWFRHTSSPKQSKLAPRFRAIVALKYSKSFENRPPVRDRSEAGRQAAGDEQVRARLQTLANCG